MTLSTQSKTDPHGRSANPRTMTDADAIVVGVGPTGITLSMELRPTGVRPPVLERHSRRLDIAEAGGLGGQILELLRYRDLVPALADEYRTLADPSLPDTSLVLALFHPAPAQQSEGDVK